MTTPTTMIRPIRLACMICDREDFDGITEAELAELMAAPTPGGWQDIFAVAEDIAGSDWWTHLGWCPDCIRAVALRTQAVRAMRRSETARAAEGSG